MRAIRRVLVLCSLLLAWGSAAGQAQTLHPYWVDMQGDNSGSGTPAQYYSFARDSVQLDAVVLTAHANTLVDTRWTNIKAAAAAFNAPGSFVAFSGYEWNSDIFGHKPTIFLTDDQPLYRPNDLGSTTADQFYSLISHTNGLSHAAHPSLPTYSTNWNYFDPDLQPNAEIISKWGIYENTGVVGRSLREIWARGYRVGVLGSSDTHTNPGVGGGLTCIMAPDLTRQGLMDGLRARHNYATNGARIGLDFKIGSAMNGDLVNTPASGDAQIYAHVDCSAPLSRVEVRRSNQLVYTHAPPPHRVFVDVGDPLSYFKGQSQPPADWSQATFNDAGWFAGRSGIGFGNGDDVTLVSGMVTKYLTLYTRQRFTVTDIAPQYLYLGVDYDDGFVAYIDGVEVLRANMPAGPVFYNTPAGPVRNANLAAKAVAGATQPPFYTDNGLASGTPTSPALDLFNLSNYGWLLTPGPHVLSIEIHNSLIGSNDLSLIPRLFEVDPTTTATVNFTDTGATGDRWYDVKVMQLDGGVAWSSPIWLNPDAPPRPVATLADVPNDNGTSLQLSWTKSVALDFRSYDLFVSDAPFNDAAGMSPWNDQPIQNADSLAATISTFNGAPLQRGQTYYVYVGASDRSGKMNTVTFGCIANASPVDNLAPAAPGSITALDMPLDDGGSIRVSWSLSADDGSGADDVLRYEIFRRKSSASYTSTPLATRSRNTSSYQDNSTLDGTQYFYKVRAHDGVNPSAYTVEVGPVVSVNNGGLSEPKNVTAVDRPGDQGGWINVAWSLTLQDANLTRYEVWRGTVPGAFGGSPLGWVPRGTASFSDSTAVTTTDYYYVVLADSAGVRRSTFSVEAGPAHSLDNVAPAAVAAFTATNTFQGGTVNLDWSGYAEGSQGDVTGYNVYYKTSSFTTLTGLAPAFTTTAGHFTAAVTGLANGTTYNFAVAPTDAAGNQTNTVVTRSAKPTDTTAPTFGGLTGAVPGDGSLTLNWHAAQDNTLPLTYNLYQSLTGSFNYTAPTTTIAGSRPLVPLGASWKFLKGTSVPPAGWNQRGFNDGGWLAGEGAFGYDTGNRYQPVTVLSDMNGVYNTVYFRANFTVSSLPSSLVMGVLVDDGYVAYLNGIEIARDNVKVPLSFSSLAQTGVNPPWSATIDLTSPTNYNPNPTLYQVDVSAFAALLQSGTNTLAFEVHNAKKTNADFLFLATLSEPNQQYKLTGLSPSKTYYYVMRAQDGAGNKDANTVVVNGKPLLAPPPQPVPGLLVGKSGNDLVLRWSPVYADSVFNPITPDHYNVYRGTAPDFLPDLAGHTNLIGSATGTLYTDMGALVAGVNYYYRVTAVTASGRESFGLSSLGLKKLVNFTYQPGQQNVYWISIPYSSGMLDAQSLVNDLNHGPFPGPVRKLTRFNPATQAEQSLSFEAGGWVGDNFAIVAGESYAVTLLSSLAWTEVGSHNANLGLNLAFHGSTSNIYWLGLPVHADYMDAQSLLLHLNGGGMPTTVSKIVHFDPATGEPRNYLYFAGQWLGQNFTITPGEGYGIVLKGDLSGWKPRVVR
jgi:hypothetical protein